MKLLVFAHVPPPHHGQAVMVELMLRGLRGESLDRINRIEGEGRDVRPARPGNGEGEPQISQIEVDRDATRNPQLPTGAAAPYHEQRTSLEEVAGPGGVAAHSTGQRHFTGQENEEPRTKNDQRDSITVFHIDARFSTGIEDIGRGGVRKVLLLAKYALQLVWFAVFKRPDVVYFVPSPGKKVAIVRDWVLIGLCRLLGLPRMFHWHAGGLSGWVEESASGWQKSLSMWVYGNAALSIIPVESERSNAAYFHPQRIVKIPNGIPDPCPDFSTSVLPQRVARLKARRTGDAHIIRVLFMGHLHGGQGAL